ncbi:hypothetical protein N826_39280 [Skermanella aerolata KACC 11604]|jgi:hypothetical protein|nr:hypothetical protein N826_39280 [Skermanella aerolata KACC 11604]
MEAWAILEVEVLGICRFLLSGVIPLVYGVRHNEIDNSGMKND